MDTDYKQKISGGSHCRVEANALESDIEVNECELQSHYCVHFLTNALGKSINPLIPPSYELDSSTLALYNPRRLICPEEDRRG